MTTGLAVVVVTYDSADSIAELLQAVRSQTTVDDEVVVVDNASKDGTEEAARRADPAATVVQSGHNAGFAAAVNDAVARTTAPLVLLLNPDAIPAEGCLQHLRTAADEHPAWGAWQALVTLPRDGGINTLGGRVHYLGFGWAGGWGEPLSAAPASPVEVGFTSGAAMCVRREAWEDVGGFERSFFMYAEDLELSLRLRLRGWGSGIVPDAVVVHDYEFDKGPNKWFYLERNRWAVVLVCYPLPLLVALLPTLLAFEVALLAVAARGGWLWPKVRAVVAASSRLPSTLRRRRAVQAARTVSSAEFAAGLTSALDGAFLAPVAQVPALAVPQRRYFEVVSTALGALARRSRPRPR